MNLDSLLNLALDAANSASEAIITSKLSLNTWIKDDNSPLSSADLAANDAINEILFKSDIAICSEESPISYEDRKVLKEFWLTDPLDGTKGFLKGSNEYCVLIALIREQRPILAVIKNPNTGDIFYAHKDTKVYKNNSPLQNNQKFFDKNKNLALVSVHHPNLENRNFLNKNKLSLLKVSSALKFATLLEGEAGVYCRFESLHSWDIAAGDFLLNQNGGLMCAFDNSFLKYNQESFFCPSFIALSKKEFISSIKL